MQPFQGSQSIAWVRGDTVKSAAMILFNQPTHQTISQDGQHNDSCSVHKLQQETNERLYCMRFKQLTIKQIKIYYLTGLCPSYCVTAFLFQASIWHKICKHIITLLIPVKYEIICHKGILWFLLGQLLSEVVFIVGLCCCHYLCWPLEAGGRRLPNYPSSSMFCTQWCHRADWERQGIHLGLVTIGHTYIFHSHNNFGTRPEFLDKSHMHMVTTCKLPRERSSAEMKYKPEHCEATALTTVPPCDHKCPLFK